MNKKQKLRTLAGAIFILVLLTMNLIVFTVTASSYRSSASNEIYEGNSASKENDKVIVKNINSWQHPIKEFFKDSTLEKVELLYKETYPIFYVKENSLTEEDVVRKYTSGTYLSMLEANGYWDFEIRTLDNKWVKIKGDKKEKKLIDIVYEGKTIDLKELSLVDKAVGEINNKKE